MNIQNAISGLAATTISNIGQSAAHSLFPNEIAFELIAFEVVDSQGFTQASFIMPLMPEQITITQVKDSSIVKSANGITAFVTDKFLPSQISINGTFGTSFRSVSGRINGIGLNNPEGLGFFSSEILSKELYVRIVKGLVELKQTGQIQQTNYLSPIAKNGYGISKIFEYILEYSRQKDASNKPQSLNMYYLGRNLAYVVINKSITFSQTTDKQGLWQYQAEFESIAPLSAVEPNLNAKTRTLLTRFVGQKAISGVSNLFKSVATNPSVVFRKKAGG